MIKECLSYIQKNISIIPVGKDKKPLIKWQEFQNRIAKKEEVNQWFKDYPDMQVGIVTGKISNLIVVDIDKPDLDVSWLPETSIVKTGSGGFHYYYSYVPNVNNKARIKEFIDIRGDGGFVVAPPSENLKGKYEIIKKLPLAIFPKNLFDKDEKINYQQIKTEYEGYGEGQRNDKMARFIGHLLAKIHPSEWENIAYKLALEANQRNTPPLTEYEVKNIFQSIASKEKSNKTERWYKQELIDNLIVKNNSKERYTWGTRNLDISFSIIKRGNFIVLGAKSGSGKTTFAFDMAQKNALLGHKVLFLSLEMDEKEVKESIARKRAGWTIQEEYDETIPQSKQEIFDNKLKEIESIENLYFRGVRGGVS